MIAEGAYGGPAIAIERRLIARQLLPAALTDDVLAQRGVQLLRFAELGPIQRRLVLVHGAVHGRRAKPTVDQDFHCLARSCTAGLAEDAGHTATRRQARLAARSERREQLAHGLGKRLTRH